MDRVEPGQGGADMEISIFGVNLGAPEFKKYFMVVFNGYIETFKDD